MRIILAVLLCMYCVGLAHAGELKKHLGYRDLCTQSPIFCEADLNTIHKASPIAFSEHLLALLKAVNDRWNKQIKVATDEDLYQKEEVWAGSTVEGDCEEFAIAKKMELLEHGYKASQLLYAIVTASAGPHLVLVIRTTNGNYVLDNLSPEVLLWEETNYPLYLMQYAEHPYFWIGSLPDDAPTASVSVR